MELDFLPAVGALECRHRQDELFAVQIQPIATLHAGDEVDRPFADILHNGSGTAFMSEPHADLGNEKAPRSG
jgi:hypothetical protein